MKGVEQVALADLDVQVNLYRDGEKFFDLLKAVLREWHKSPWPHEQERAAYAKALFSEALAVYQNYLTRAREKVAGGYATPADQKLLQRMEERFNYWQGKFQELTEKKEPTCS
jgi:tRNA A37 N6-isopentenylltransferase MiaA